MGDTLDNLSMFAQFPGALRRFLQHPLTLEQAKAITRQNMECREDNFLQMAEKSIYGHPTSPYLALLRLAGCELGDLRVLVRQRGLEGALYHLREAGVYVAYEEFKGRKPIERYGQVIPVKPRDFDNPFMVKHFGMQSGGSSGAAMNVGISLDHIAIRAHHEMLSFQAHGVLDAPGISWRGILPDSSISQMLGRAYSGRVQTRWFSPHGLFDSKDWLKYSAATYYILLWMRLFGVKVPPPEYVALTEAVTIARCMADLVKKHGKCVLSCQVSRAVRVCVAAQEAGIDLRGAAVKSGGEPPTPAKVQRIHDAGVHYISSYAMVGTGAMAAGCVLPVNGSDVHLFSDTCALFSFPYRVEGYDVEVPAFNITTLLPQAAKLLLNVQMDDYGVVEERACGCELDSYGFHTHLRDIRSYSKLTGEGVTLIGSEVEKILETVLPARFGGSPLDYQLMESEDEQGLTRLYLIVSPRITLTDEQAAVEVLMDALGNSSGMAEAARSVWMRSETIKVKRMEPIWTRRGKMMPLHIEQRMKNHNSTHR